MKALLRLLLLVMTTGIVMPATANVENPLIFSGKALLLVVSGYSTPSVWPHILQRKIDRYHDDKRIIEVRSVVVASTPIARLMDVKTGKPKDGWQRIDEAIAARGDRPFVLLARQSPQWSFDPRRRTGICSPDDTIRIRIGSAVLRTYHNLLLRTGADHVILPLTFAKRPWSQRFTMNASQ